MDLSIIIPNWNGERFLELCLRSIFQSMHGGTEEINLEVFVVDNNSSDGSVDMVRAKFPQVNLIRNKNNLGFSKANNQGIRKSNGRYVLLLNSDTLVLGGALSSMVKFMDTHPCAGAAGCKLLNPDGTLQRSCFGSFPNLETEFYDYSYLSQWFPYNRIFGKHLMKWMNYDHIREIDHCLGACIIVPRATIADVGLMDEQFFIYFEETDWLYRMKKKGWKIYYIPEAKVVHFGGRSTQGLPDRDKIIMDRSYGSKLRFFRKHYGFAITILLEGLILARYALKFLKWSLIYLIMPSNHAESKNKLGVIWCVISTVLQTREN